MLRVDSRLLRYIAAPIPTEDDLNGLWTCRLCGNEAGAIPLAIYQYVRLYAMLLLLFYSRR